MIDAQNTTTTLYSYQNGIGANTEAILNRTLRHILYGGLYNGGNGGGGIGGGGNGGGGNGGGGNGGGGNGGGGEIPSNEMHFTTLVGSVDYVGTEGDQIFLSDNSVVDITVTDERVTFNAPSGKHKVKLVESVGRHNYVSVGGEALVELHNFPTLSTVTKFNFATHNFNPLPNLTKVPNVLPSNITNIEFLFYLATNFNQDISMWDVSNVTNMSGMFHNASSFNQPLNNWDVSNVFDMSNMFSNASAFNQDLSLWCVSNFPSIPTDFDAGATNWTLPQPVWGTCPAP